MSRRILLALALVVGTWGFSPAPPSAAACPMCKAGLDGDEARPRAYMVSILFMLTVPLCLFSGLGYGLWRLSRQESARLEAAGHGSDR
tara:strand:+ start:332 stop:595 length:264 start_codon:yes stop_codon:yes gene_type:complete